MHWLQSIDTALFHFINSTLANPFFDWLMPILSGDGVPWLLAVIIAVPAVLIWGSPRLKICALLMVLVVSLGDGLIVNSVKNAVSRPRPFVTQPDARLFGETGKGYVAPLPDGGLPASANRHSFPSAHAANCFALATVAFLFYRRSARFMFPFAAAVAFSRVYNGVHYPSDIAVGAILGAGYAIALVFLTQSLWTFSGKKFFPAWHEKLPNLLHPEIKKSEIRNPKSETEWLRLGCFVIVLVLVGRWIYLGSGLIELSQDEAYQWLWSKHLALSYYSKPPGIAFIQRAGTALFGDNAFGVRFFSPLFSAILSWLILRFLAREIGGRNAFFFLLITLATPLFVAGSVLMTIDPPLVLCWMLSVLAGWRAVQPDGKTRDWFIVGIAAGLGFLCKYTALFLPVCWAVFFALRPAARAHLRKPGPWLALGVLAFCTLPVLIWNAQHGWITVHHVAGNAGLQEPWHPTLKYFFSFFIAELGLLNPIFFIAMLWATFAFWKRRAEKPLQLFLFCMGAPVFFGYWLYSFHSNILANWIAPAVPPLFCLMALFWSERKIKPWLAGGIVLGLLASALMYDGDLLGKIAAKLPGEKDPSHRVRGWRETAQLIEGERAKFDTNAFIIAEDYGTTGLLSFYSPRARAAVKSGEPLVYVIDSKAPENQFFFWDEYDYRTNRPAQNAIFVRHLSPCPLEPGWIWKWLRHEKINPGEIPAPDPAPRRIVREFTTVTNLGIREIKLKDGRVFQRVQIFGCYHLK